MIELGKIDEIITKLGESLPPGAARLREDLEDRFRPVLRKSLEKLDLVSREEFETQAAVLERLQVKLEALERQLGDLEKG